MVVGAFAATVYGLGRVTHDIDLIVNLKEEHIRQLAAAYIGPRYYADPIQMRDSIRLGMMFNIVDTTRGEKADLIPLAQDQGALMAFRRRVRQQLDFLGSDPFPIWCARADDVIVGKLAAWLQGKSRKHESDIREMLVFHYLSSDPVQGTYLDETYVDAQSSILGPEAAQFWQALKTAARIEAGV